MEINIVCAMIKHDLGPSVATQQWSAFGQNVTSPGTETPALNATEFFPNASSTANPLLSDVKYYLSGIVNPILCVLGVLGNVLNMVVLTRRRVQVAMDCSMEQAAHLGLVALALSDLLYCLTSLSAAFIRGPTTFFTHKSLEIYIQMYGKSFQNIFMNTSTWLTVIMAAGRYAAICRPLHARYLVEIRATRVAVFSSFIFWSLLHLPSFWTYRLVEVRCDNTSYYILDHGYFVLNAKMKTSFMYVWSVLGYFIPVVILSYCNVHLIRALRESYRVRQLYRVHPKPAKFGTQITPTLVAIVCMYIILVSPSEVLQFCYYCIQDNNHNVEFFLIAIIVTNVLHTINFACNFVLYCIVNVHFRQAWKNMVCCKLRQKYNRIQRRNTSSHSNISTKSYMFPSALLCEEMQRGTEQGINHHEGVRFLNSNEQGKHFHSGRIPKI